MLCYYFICAVFNYLCFRSAFKPFRRIKNIMSRVAGESDTMSSVINFHLKDCITYPDCQTFSFIPTRHFLLLGFSIFCNRHERYCAIPIIDSLFHVSYRVSSVYSATASLSCITSSIIEYLKKKKKYNSFMTVSF